MVIGFIKCIAFDTILSERKINMEINFFQSFLSFLFHYFVLFTLLIEFTLLKKKKKNI